jgi:prepilin-type processing-associated H-X9-DG protein
LDIYGTGSPNSLHPGGVNVGFADGSVKFIKDSIDTQTWWALGSRANGEVISDGVSVFSARHRTPNTTHLSLAAGEAQCWNKNSG